MLDLLYLRSLFSKPINWIFSEEVIKFGFHSFIITGIYFHLHNHIIITSHQSKAQVLFCLF